MQLQHYKPAFAGGWVLAVGGIGVAIGVTSVSAFILLAAIALLPPFVMFQLWHAPDQSISESIQEARR